MKNLLLTLAFVLIGLSGVAMAQDDDTYIPDSDSGETVTPVAPDDDSTYE